MRGSWMPIGSSSTLRFDTMSCLCQLPPLTLMYVQTLVLQHSTVPLTSSLSSDDQQVSQDDVLELLAKAVTCAILGKASNQRSRVLGNLAQVQYVQHVLCLCQHVLWGHTQHRWLTGCVCMYVLYMHAYRITASRPSIRAASMRLTAASCSRCMRNRSFARATGWLGSRRL